MIQEEPLPHELRPIGVLQMTMDYLVTMVMDKGHERLGDWYDFVWNRTRAIRKVGLLRCIITMVLIVLLRPSSGYYTATFKHL